MPDQQIPDSGQPQYEAPGVAPNSQTHAATGGGAFVGGSVNTGGGHFVGRDQIVLAEGATLNIQYYPITLRAQLREAFDTLLDNRTALFGGRRPILRRIAALLEQPGGGYLAVTAPAGFGKTALAATIVRSNEAAFAYHFFTPQLADSLTEHFFLENIVEQMAQWHGYTEPLPSRIADLRALYHYMLDQPLDRTRVLVLDGLDEVTHWDLAQYLGRQLPPGLKLIVTIRDVGQDWASLYTLPQSQLQHLCLGGLERDDIAEALAAGGAASTPLAANAALIDEIMRVAAAETEPASGADPLYVRLLIEDLAANKLDPATISQQPSGLNPYLERWWSELHQRAEASAAQDLLGTLAVALGPMQRAELEAINPGLAGSWATGFRQTLGQVRRFVAGDDIHGYVLAHPRFREYVRRQPEVKPYHNKLLAYCDSWQATGSTYALTYYVQHLQAAAQLDQLFTVVLNAAFRDAQQAVLGDRSTTLSDLRTALKLALERDDLVRVLACAGAYRTSSDMRHLTATLFAALDQTDWQRAFKLAALPPVAADWTSVLWLLIAWTAAEAQQQQVATDAVRHALRMPVESQSELFERLLVRIARSVAALPGSQHDAAGWLQAWNPSQPPEQLLAASAAATLPDQARQQELLTELDQHFGYYSGAAQHAEMPMFASEFYAAEMAADPIQNEEHAGYLADRLAAILVVLAPTPVGHQRIQRALAVVLPNPYPRYRDIGLKAIGTAVAALPDAALFQQSLRAIVSAALDREGVTFTFDLPAVLLAEASRRQQIPPQLAEYLQHAEAYADRWGTALRVHSAQAGALFRIGRADRAFDRLRFASQQPGGFAGFLCVALLTLADRCFELGRPEAAHQAQWGRNHNVTLLQGAYELAHNVRDPAFRDQRIMLVHRYDEWTQTSPPDVRTAITDLATERDEDVRHARIAHLSARWSWPAAAPHWDGIKALVPLALAHGTTLDAVLARLAGLRIASLSNSEFNAAITICLQQLATAQPWEHRQWR